MKKKWNCLGLMSGTSGDGVDASIIETNGINQYNLVKNKYFEYSSDIYKDIHNLKEKIHKFDHLKKYNDEIINLERKITLFHAEIIENLNIGEETIIGFHGQTIYHNPNDKISKQLGNGKLLNQLTKKKIVYNFRNNDIKHGGQGAPLAPIFHQIIASQNGFELPVYFLNIGGISNVTIVKSKDNFTELESKDIGPGNCLIDNWVRKNSDHKFDKHGLIALSGKNQIIFEQAQELYMNRNNKYKKSFDINDFDISFVRGLDLADGVATLTDFTASIIGEELSLFLRKFKSKSANILLCGGGRKNHILIKRIQENLTSDVNLKSIDEYNIDGDFIESQAFAFLAVRAFFKTSDFIPKYNRL